MKNSGNEGVAFGKGRYRKFTGYINCCGIEGFVENADFDLLPDDMWTIRFNRGTWLGGTWKKGQWMKGTWMDGTWLSGDWMSGSWKTGTWHDGTWHDGSWLGGGKWRKGTWMTGKTLDMGRTEFHP